MYRYQEFKNQLDNIRKYWKTIDGEIYYLDKLVDELAKGKSLEKLLIDKEILIFILNG